MASGWTGAQYSAFRACFGLYLAWHSAQSLPWGGPSIVALLASSAFIVGFYDRIAAIAVGGAAVFSSFAAGPCDAALPVIVWMLLLHALMIPSAPFGSWSA